MKAIAKYALETTTYLSFEEAIRRVTERLADEGFGVLTEIDVGETLKKKLGVETKPYRILGACHPPSAHRALAAEPHVGVLLPCNVAIWDEGGHRVVSAMDPRALATWAESPEVHRVAEDVAVRIRRVIEGIERDQV